MSDQPKLHAWVSAFTFSNGGTSVAMTIAPDEAQAAAAGMHNLVRGTPALASPDIGLTFAMTVRVDEGWLATAYRAVIEGQKPIASVLSLVPKAETIEAMRDEWIAANPAAYEIGRKFMREAAESTDDAPPQETDPAAPPPLCPETADFRGSDDHCRC